MKNISVIFSIINLPNSGVYLNLMAIKGGKKLLDNFAAFD